MEDQKRSGCVTFFDAWPGVPAIECDGALFVDFYITGIASPCAPWLKINPASEFGKSVLEQFKFKPSQITARLNNPQQLSAWIAQNSQEPVRDEVLPARG
jgi:hypothetical protein